MITKMLGKLYNEDGEMVAEGACEINDDRRSVTLRPPFEMPLLERQHGTLRLELDDGTELSLSARVLRFRTNIPGSLSRNVYRLFMTEQQPLVPWAREQGAGDEQGGPRAPHAREDDGGEIPLEFRRE